MCGIIKSIFYLFNICRHGIPSWYYKKLILKSVKISFHLVLGKCYVLGINFAKDIKIDWSLILSSLDEFHRKFQTNDFKDIIFVRRVHSVPETWHEYLAYIWVQERLYYRIWERIFYRLLRLCLKFQMHLLLFKCIFPLVVSQIFSVESIFLIFKNRIRHFIIEVKYSSC